MNEKLAQLDEKMKLLRAIDWALFTLQWSLAKSLAPINELFNANQINIFLHGYFVTKNNQAKDRKVLSRTWKS